MTIRELARLATAVENGRPAPADLLRGKGLIVGITGPPGAGKSSLVDALTAEFRAKGKTVAIVAVDPSSGATGGAIMGDRIRMQRHHADPGVFIRSTATRGAHGGLARTTASLSRLFRDAGFDIVFIETVGVGQDEIEIAHNADITVVVLVPGMGDEVQAIKAGIMEVADIFVVNKADYPGADKTCNDLETLKPIFKTIATEGTGIPALAEALLRRRTGGSACPLPRDSTLDHIGISVRSIEESRVFYESALELRLTQPETIDHEGVRVSMAQVGDARIELLEPLHQDSPIAKRGPGLHHIALKVPDLNVAIARLEDQGARLLNRPQPGAGGHLYVFIHPASTGGVLWELIQA